MKVLVKPLGWNLCRPDVAMVVEQGSEQDRPGDDLRVMAISHFEKAVVGQILAVSLLSRHSELRTRLPARRAGAGIAGLCQVSATRAVGLRSSASCLRQTALALQPALQADASAAPLRA